MRLILARNTDAEGAAECLRLPGVRCLRCDLIQATSCLLTNEVRFAPVSVSSQLHVMCNKEYGGSVVPSRLVLSVVLVGEADGLVLVACTVLGS